MNRIMIDDDYIELFGFFPCVELNVCIVDRLFLAVCKTAWRYCGELFFQRIRRDQFFFFTNKCF
jgi:hypothetical protein